MNNIDILINDSSGISSDKQQQNKQRPNPIIHRNNISYERLSGYRNITCNNSFNLYSRYTDTLKIDSKYSNNIFYKIYNYLTKENAQNQNKDFDIIIIGAPHYAPDIKFAVVVAASAQYRTKKNDEQTPLSTVSLSADVSTSGYVYCGFRGITIFNKDKLRLCHDIHYYSQKNDFWGVGYEMGRYAKKSIIRRLKGLAKFDFIYNVYDEIYIGPAVTFSYLNGLHFSDISYINGEQRKNFNLGLGILFIYDSRDFAPNAQKGIYFGFEQSISPSALSNSGTFQKSEMFLRYYKLLWQGGILASEFRLASVYGDTPWSILPTLGGSSNMRGYYEGRYRDRNLVSLQIELRQKIYKRHGMAFWIGAGNVFHDYNKIRFSHTLPNFGIGYRWEFRNRINIRMDIGIGLDQTGVIFNVEEAF